MNTAYTFGLFFLTALAEIVGCYLPFLWIKKDKSPLLLIPGAMSLILFAWLLTLHPDAAGRTYAAYGGIYVFTAIFWLWFVENQIPKTTDFIGAGLVIAGAIVILFPRIFEQS